MTLLLGSLQAAVLYITVAASKPLSLFFAPDYSELFNYVTLRCSSLCNYYQTDIN